MKNTNKTTTILTTAKQKEEAARREQNRTYLLDMASLETQEVLERLNSSLQGLTEEQAEIAQDEYGRNVLSRGREDSVLKRIAAAFINPFTIILMLLASVSTVTDIILPPAGQKDPATALIITTMVLISGVLRFVQEMRSGNAAAKLTDMIRTTTCVERVEVGKEEILLEEVTVGDIVHLSAGDMVPADMRILFAKDMFISQSALTGESEAVEKYSHSAEVKNLTDACNIAFMGSTVISGSAYGVVVATGDNSLLGSMAKALSEKPVETSFEKGVNEVSWILIRFMLVMVPIVFTINAITKNDWMDAALFAISIAVGLTPEMLPMIVTTCLAKGAVAMSKEKVIIKNLNSIQCLGSMDILCTDKTGTLTQDRVVLQYHLNIDGQEDVRVLRHGFLNSYYQTGLKNLMDVAIISYAQAAKKEHPELAYIDSAYTKVDEIPFDFERRRMSVVVSDKAGKTQLITKGAVEEMIQVSSFVDYGGKVHRLTDERKEMIFEKAAELNAKGMRVIAVAQKTNPSPVGAFSVADESEMVLIGYLAFLDPPKPTTAAAIKALHDYGVEVKVLTGDNERVTKSVCKQVGLSVDKILMGDELDMMDDTELALQAERITVFAKLSPEQKARVVRVLREKGHCVGYMGDGINDAAAMKVADAGISVDTAVDIAKESASVILLEKDLTVLQKGVIEGRKTYANMIKYIKMTASSNFGNMFSVLIASAFLPFLPMESVHLLLLNLIYDVSCIAIPWDNVDADYLLKPRDWDASSVGRFMLWMGPVSSIFDIATYLIMFYVICPLCSGGLHFSQLSSPAQVATFVAVFQAGWFIESMWSQSLVVHMIRTPKLPFIQSRASRQVILFGLVAIVVASVIPFTPLAHALHMASLPPVYFAVLAAIIACYMLLATVVKKQYVRRYGELL